MSRSGRASRRSGVTGDAGSAVVEFVSLGVLLMVPLVYLVLAMARVQAASFAADGSARDAARAYVTAANTSEAQRRSVIAVRIGLEDQGFRTGDGTLTVECDWPACLVPGARVTARVSVTVVLPGIPRGVGDALSTHVTVRAAQVATVDEFRAPGGRP
jgi:hypothetical protein